MKTLHSLVSILACLWLAAVSQPAHAQQYSWSTVAGTPTVTGSTDTGALFNIPSGMARDPSGNVFVADGGNHTIRKMTSSGTVSTFAGTAGLSGLTNGTGAAARFNTPFGIAVDAAYNLYVADTFNHLIRKITPAGVVTTFAGQAGVAGSADGNATATATFNRPTGVVVLSNGDIYVADQQSHIIRRISGGVVTTVAGTANVSGSNDGIGAAARFNSPARLALDGTQTTLYISDFNNYLIRRMSIATSQVTTVAGLAGTPGSTDGTGNAARFDAALGLAVDGTSNTIFVADRDNHCIRKINAAGEVTTLCGLPGYAGHVDGTGSNARLSSPKDLIIDGTSNTLLVSESDTSPGSTDQTIRRIGFDGSCKSWQGTPGLAGSRDSAGPVTLNGPAGVARDSNGNFFVSDWGGGLIRKVTPGGVVSTFASGLNRPYGMAVDAAGNLYVAEQSNHIIRKITPAGAVSVFAGQLGTSGSTDGTGSAARFNQPVDVQIDSVGNLYVADIINHTIRKITPGAVVSTLAGLAGQTGSADGLGSTARFLLPNAVAVDGSANVYVSDSNNTIRKITPAGLVSTLAGQTGIIGSTDGTGSAARFNLGEGGFTCDSAGNLIVADQVNNTLRKVTPAGVVTTLAGFAGSAGTTDGTGSAARFDYPLKMAIDPQGNVYVPCYNTNTVRKVTPGGVVTTFLGTPTSSGATNTSGVFNGSSGVVLDAAGNIYVADQNNHTIRRITPGGAVSTLAGLAGSPGTANGTGSAARFNTPYDLTINSTGTTLYVADTSNHAIRTVTIATGAVNTLAGLPGTSGNSNATGISARFNRPNGISIDSAGAFLYIGDNGNNCVRRVQIISGAVSTFAGSTSGVAGSVDGTTSAARFNGPAGTAVDASGNVYVADASNNVIRRISGGNVTTWAGSVTPGSADGVGTAARFRNPMGCAVDAQGNVFVAGGWEYAIRKISPAQVVTTIGGLGQAKGYLDGVGTATRFGWAAHIALDAAGNLYVADEDNACIRKGTRYGTKARLVQPAFGESLPAATTVFAWEPGIGATNYALFIGSTPGAYDLYAGIEGTNLSRSVTLPGGIKVYVTLWSFIGGAWQGNHYAFDPAPTQTGVLTSPALGSTLASATLALQWAGGQGCSQYAVWIGSAYGGYDLGAGGYTPSTNSANFTVPTDGGPIYVTLWSYINGAWQRNDSWFITQLGAGNRPARLTLPATNGSTISGNYTFTWDNGVGATSYALWVGSTPDGYDLYNGLEATGTSRQVGIPADGRKIYVTLHTLISGAYQSNSYQFTAGGSSLSSPGAVITSTTPGVGSYAVTWSTAPGATNYALWVGSASGAYDIYAGSEGLSTSKTVSVPTDGRELHFTIWSLIGGKYYPNMSTATATNTGGTQRARITSHTQGASLPSLNTTFAWDLGTGVSQYAIWVGSTANSYDIYNAVGGTSATLNLPTDGRQVHVTLYSMIGGVWQGNGYLFFAPKTPSSKAALITPATGSTFTGSTANFSWIAGTGATQYYLFIGSQAGGYDLYAGSQGTNLSAPTITGLPTDARPIHVTLYSLIDGVWQGSPYVFRAWQSP